MRKWGDRWESSAPGPPWPWAHLAVLAACAGRRRLGPQLLQLGLAAPHLLPQSLILHHQQVPVLLQVGASLQRARARGRGHVARTDQGEGRSGEAETVQGQGRGERWGDREKEKRERKASDGWREERRGSRDDKDKGRGEEEMEEGGETGTAPGCTPPLSFHFPECESNKESHIYTQSSHSYLTSANKN